MMVMNREERGSFPLTEGVKCYFAERVENLWNSLLTKWFNSFDDTKLNFDEIKNDNKCYQIIDRKIVE